MKALEPNLDFGEVLEICIFFRAFLEKSSIFNEDLSLEDDLIRKI